MENWCFGCCHRWDHEQGKHVGDSREDCPTCATGSGKQESDRGYGAARRARADARAKKAKAPYRGSVVASGGRGLAGSQACDRVALVIGIDPGLADLGWGILDMDGRRNFSTVAYGCIKTKRDPASSAPADLRRRCDELAVALDDAFGDAIDDARDSGLSVHVAMEEFRWYGNMARERNITSTIQLANVCGMIAENFRHRGMGTVEQFSAADLRAMLGLHKKASKADVQKRVGAVLGMDKLPRPQHAADALGIAISMGLRV
jgi:crossover junction endodeoxyribonuclease RuvC